MELCYAKLTRKGCMQMAQAGDPWAGRLFTGYRPHPKGRSAPECGLREGSTGTGKGDLAVTGAQPYGRGAAPRQGPTMLAA